MRFESRSARGSVLIALLVAATPRTVSAAPPAQDGLELKRFKASETTDAMYVLRATGCRKASDTCKLELELSEGAEGKRKARLPDGMAHGIQQAPSGTASSERWTSGEEERNVTTSVQPVRLTADAWGLLVTQESGFEHVHRRHRLYVVKDGGVAEAWKGDENFAGPEQSSVSPYPLTPDSPVEGFFREYVFLSADADSGEPDQWKLQAYRWDATAQKVVKERRPERHAAIIGSFKTVREAIAYREDTQSEKLCTNDFLVLESTSFKRLTPGLFIVTKLLPEKKAAEAALKKVSACNPKVSGYVKAP
ncbi:hypothetical protein JYK02_04950 [Corallococcus macrosporus]|uniref:SPOR domain-containing protein n=1 Tax=Corallococcus macrosporus TaxID=35 RepID=A0ABS3D939_9BACT|nr:hypothetical protein [Corallococcus macrosporus]MBN8226855.1 hypothetical protein [Corallococcus macrosporus]